jgi:hypothetical protein
VTAQYPAASSGEWPRFSMALQKHREKRIMRFMQEPAEALLFEFLDWISSRPRTYSEAMEAWRTNCPRHSVWEDALGEGLITFEEQDRRVTLTARGRALLASR